MSIFDSKSLQEQVQSLPPEPAPTSPPEKKGIGPLPYLAMLGGEVADVGTTVAAKRRGAVEANPTLGSFGPVGMGAKAGSALLIALLMRKLAGDGHPTLAKSLGYGVGAGLTGVAIRNSQVGK